MTRTVVLSAAAAVLLGGCAVKAHTVAAERPAVEVDRVRLPQKVAGVEGVEKGLFRDGRVFVGGQPSAAALASLAKLGVVAVVNLRTPAEIADKAQVPYEEGAEAERLGMEYVNVPIGGSDHPYAPAALERFADVLGRVRGPVLLHCRTGVRASTVWVAYLVRYGGLDLDAAVARGRAIALPPDPIELLLARPLKLVPAAAR